MPEFLRDREAFSKLANKVNIQTRNNWYDIDNRAEDEAIIWIYSDIGWIGATAEEFADELAEITAQSIRVRINSYGGSVFDGIAIYNALRSHPSFITTQVDAIAASIASVIAQAGDRRVMMESSEMMIHEATGIALGATAADMRELAEILDNQTTKIADIYARRSGSDDSEKFLEMMRAGKSNLGTWLSDDEAVTEGLADEVVAPESKEAPEPADNLAGSVDLSGAANTTSHDSEPEPEPVSVGWASVFPEDPDDYEWTFATTKEKL